MLNSQSTLLKTYNYFKPHAKIASFDQFAAKSLKTISLSETKRHTHWYSHPAGWTSYLWVYMQQMMQENRGSTKKPQKVVIFRSIRQDIKAKVSKMCSKKWFPWKQMYRNTITLWINLTETARDEWIKLKLKHLTSKKITMYVDISEMKLWQNYHYQIWVIVHKTAVNNLIRRQRSRLNFSGILHGGLFNSSSLKQF